MLYIQNGSPFSFNINVKTSLQETGKPQRAALYIYKEHSIRNEDTVEGG